MIGQLSPVALARPRGVDSAKMIQVIVTESLRGCGAPGGVDRCRLVKQYWSLDGKLLAENDPCYPAERPAVTEPTPLTPGELAEWRTEAVRQRDEAANALKEPMT